MRVDSRSTARLAIGGPNDKVVESSGLLLAMTMPARAQDWRQQLTVDLVTISNGRMTSDDVGLYKVEIPGNQPAPFQVRIHSEAPAGGLVSRDNCVSLTTMIASTVFITAFAESYKIPASEFMQHIDYTQLKSALGTPDLELNLTMTNVGMQVEVASGQKARQTMTWEQVYAK